MNNLVSTRIRDILLMCQLVCRYTIFTPLTRFSTNYKKRAFIEIYIFTIKELFALNVIILT